MPEMDGFELTKSIREAEKESGARIPIVAITASVLQEEINSCYAAGMDDFIPQANGDDSPEKYIGEMDA